MISCSVHVDDARIIAANVADYPIKTKRFSIVVDDRSFIIEAQDFTAFKAALNAVYNALTTFHAMQTIP